MGEFFFGLILLLLFLHLFGGSLKKLLKKNSNEGSFRNSKSTLKVGITESEPAVCPYCKVALPKRPKAKTKCKSCGKHMYARTRPSDGKKVILTDEEAKAVEIEWMKENGTYENHLREQKEFEEEREALSKRLGGQASDRDVGWSLLNKRILKAVKKADWQDYSQARHEMAFQTFKEKKHKVAVSLFCESCFLHTNLFYLGDNLMDPEIVAKVRINGYESTEIANGQLAFLLESVSALDMDKEDLKKEYFKVSENLQSFMKLPIAPQVGWGQIESYLEINLKSKSIRED